MLNFQDFVASVLKFHIFSINFNHHLLSGRDKSFVSSPKCPDRLWGQPSLLFGGYWYSFPVMNWLSVRLTTQLCLIVRLRMNWAIVLLSMCLHGMVIDSFILSVGWIGGWRRKFT